MFLMKSFGHLRGRGKRSRKTTRLDRRAETSRWQPRLAEELEDRALLSIVSYSTYWGGSRNDVATDVAADSEGNTYVIGTTESANLGGDSGPDTFAARAFLTKFNPEGDVEYTKVLGPTPKWDSDGYTESFGFDVIIGPDDLPIVAVETFETTTVELGDGS